MKSTEYSIAGDFNIDLKAFGCLSYNAHDITSSRTGTFNGVTITTDRDEDMYHIKFNIETKTIFIPGYGDTGITFKLDEVSGYFILVGNQFRDKNQSDLNRVLDIVKAFRSSVKISEVNDNFDTDDILEYIKGVHNV